MVYLDTERVGEGQREQLLSLSTFPKEDPFQTIIGERSLKSGPCHLMVDPDYRYESKGPFLLSTSLWPVCPHAAPFSYSSLFFWITLTQIPGLQLDITLYRKASPIFPNLGSILLLYVSIASLYSSAFITLRWWPVDRIPHQIHMFPKQRRNSICLEIPGSDIPTGTQ